MGAPVAEKTWQFAPNLLVSAQNGIAQAQYLMWQFHNAVINFPLNPWTVAGSCNSSSAGMDGVDRWTSYASLKWSTAAHSWIVYNHPSGVQILFDHDTGAGELTYSAWSPGALFTGGSTTAPPTATDLKYGGSSWPTGCGVISGAGTGPYWSGYSTSSTNDDKNIRHHIWHSTDGLVTYWAIFQAGNCCCFWHFGELAEERAAHSPAFCMGNLGSSNTTPPINILTTTLLTDNDHIFTCKTGAGAVAKLSLYMACQGGSTTGWIESAAGAVMEEWDNELNVTAVTVYGESGGAKGPKGRLPDVYWTQRQVVAMGDTSPNDPNQRDWVHFGAFCLPWTGDATVPLIA